LQLWSKPLLSKFADQIQKEGLSVSSVQAIYYRLKLEFRALKNQAVIPSSRHITLLTKYLTAGGTIFGALMSNSFEETCAKDFEGKLDEVCYW
jgi:hypothetical protein